MPVDVAFRYACLHGAEHAWSRLKWLIDAHALASRLGDSRIVEIFRAEQARGYSRAMAQALMLRAQLLAAPVPQEIEAELRADRRAVL